MCLDCFSPWSWLDVPAVLQKWSAKRIFLGMGLCRWELWWNHSSPTNTCSAAQAQLLPHCWLFRANPFPSWQGNTWDSAPEPGLHSQQCVRSQYKLHELYTRSPDLPWVTILAQRVQGTSSFAMDPLSGVQLSSTSLCVVCSSSGKNWLLVP